MKKTPTPSRSCLSKSARVWLTVRTGLVACAAFVLLMPVSGAQLLFVSGTTAGALAACDANDMEETCEQASLVGGGESVVASYTDGNGNSAQLTARDGFLYCQWDASVNPHATAGFVPSDYASGCAITGTTSGGTAECAAGRTASQESSDAAGPTAGGGTAVGECKLIELDLVERENIVWSVSVYGFEFSVKRTTTTGEVRETATEVMASGGCGGGIEVEATFAGRIPIPRIQVDFGCSGSVGGSISSKVQRYNEDSIEIYERHALMMGFTNQFVSTVAKITSLAWSGKQFGCDGLDLVEFLIGEREIDGYSVAMSTVGAPSGSLVVNLQNSELVDVTSQGSYDAVVRGPNGFTAEFENHVGFSSSVAFDTDYEYPEVLAEDRLPPILLATEGAQESIDAVLSYAAGKGYAVSLISGSLAPDEFAAVSGMITLESLQDWSGDLAKAVAGLFLTNQTLASSATFSTQACSPLETTPDPQPWTATGAVASLSGASTGKATSRSLIVDVIMDLAYIPPL